MDFVKSFLEESAAISLNLNQYHVQDLVVALKKIKDQGGRVFVLGLGGSAANASHMVTDLRKICNIHAYAPTDNVAELTARANDEHFDFIFSKWLRTSNLNDKDALFVMSVSGGNITNNPWSSVSLINAIQVAKECGAKVLGICGDPGGWMVQNSDVVLVVPILNKDHKYQHAETVQSVIWHLFTAHPLLKENER